MGGREGGRKKKEQIHDQQVAHHYSGLLAVREFNKRYLYNQERMSRQRW